MSDQSLQPPDLNTLLRELKFDILSTINCAQLGRIKKYNKNRQTAEIEIQVKRRVDAERIVTYPLLVDCPVFILQGGGAYIDFPIATGDFCIILFNDRNIDTWFASANVAEPATNRAHDLSDGIALVGLNPLTSLLSLNGSLLRIVGPGGSDAITIDNTGAINIGTGGAAAARTGDATQLTMSPTDIQALATALLATGAFTASGSGPVPGTQTVFSAGEITGGSSEVNIK